MTRSTNAGRTDCRHRKGPAGRGGRHSYREVSHELSVRDIGSGREQAAVTQHLRDGLPARADVKERQGAPTAKAVRT